MTAWNMSSPMACHLMSIVLPVQDQADHIEQVALEYIAALNSLPVPWEIILVVNGCTDASATICRAVTCRCPHVEMCETRDGGWGLAVRTGLARSRGDLLCYTNSARTAAEDLLMMLQYGLANPNAVVKANRKIRDSWQRRIGSLLFNLECRALFNLICWDVNGTPKVFPRSFDRLLELSRDDDLFDVEFALVCHEASYPMLEVPLRSTRRHGGRSTTRYRRAAFLYWGAYEMWRGDGRSRSAW